MPGDDAGSRPTLGMATRLVSRGHERRDVSVPGLLLAAIGLAVAALVIQIVLWFQLRHDWRVREAGFPPAARVARPLPAPPAPRLQTSPREDLAQLRDEEARILASYGWVDVQRGIIRIPVERAIALEAGAAR